MSERNRIIPPIAGRFLAGCFWLLFIGIQLVFGQTSQRIPDISRLEALEGEALWDSVGMAYEHLLTIHDYGIRNQLARELFDFTVRKDEIAHIRSLVFHAMYFSPNAPSLFNEAYRLARKHQRVDDINLVEYSRGNYYIARKQYDSAMVHLLSYRDNTPEDPRGEGYRNILNLLGDLYYHAGLYDQAIETYTGILSLYEEEANWNHYRPYVMMNNLGQISLLQGDPAAGNRWFNRSLSLAEEHLRESYRINTLAYTRIKLAETALLTDSIDCAVALLREVSDYPQEAVREEVLQEYRYIHARLLLREGDIRGAEILAKQLLPADSLLFTIQRFVPEVYLLLAEIHEQQGDYREALRYQERYLRLSDSLRIQEHLSQSMIILADRNHAETRRALERSRGRVYNLVIGLVFLVVTLVIVLVFYRRLYRSRLALVRKSLESIAMTVFQEPRPDKPDGIQHKYDGFQDKSEGAEDEPARTPGESSGVADDPVGGADVEEVYRHKRLISALRELMEREAPYLDPKVNIQDIARMLESNRTYLSRAINQQLKTTFPNFVNEYRIRKAIRMITEGYTRQHTQEALAKECGFANRTVFSSVFKKHTGVTPSFFATNYGSAMSDER